MGLLRHGGMTGVRSGVRAVDTGSFSRAFTFGHERLLGTVAPRFQARMNEQTPVVAGAEEYAVVEYAVVAVEDSVIERHGYAKAGAGFDNSAVRGLNAALGHAVSAPFEAVAPTQRARKRAAHSAPGADA